MKKATLREYQAEMLSRLGMAWTEHRSVMVQMPTGTGKTVLLAAMIRSLSPGLSPEGEGSGGVLVVAHRRELIAQISQMLDAAGIAHGLIVSGRETDTGKAVQVASIQTLTQRMKDETEVPDSSSLISRFPFSTIVIDEAHHALAATYRMLWKAWPEARFLGLTATPCRLNNAPFTDLFDVLLQSWSIQEFIDRGWLSDFEYVSASPDSEMMRRVRRLQKRGTDGDFQTKEMALVMDVPESVRHLYDTYTIYARGKKGIVYAIDRQHAQHIATYYAEHGVRCAVIDARTPARERQRMVEDYRRGGLDVIVNVDVFSEGFDCPEVEFIQLARPTLSLSKYLQQVGRGMRVSKGKPHVLILDNVGLYQTFGLPTESRDWLGMFHGRTAGKGDHAAERYVLMDDSVGTGSRRELVNLQMVRIKKAGQRHTGLEVFLQNGHYGVMNGGRVTCQPRFHQIVRLRDVNGYFAAGVYAGVQDGRRVEYSSLIDKNGVDMNLRLFRDVVWENGIFYSYYKPGSDDMLFYVYWDPKGKCYYDYDPEFEMMAGVEVAVAHEHFGRGMLCYKLRYSTGRVSPRFDMTEVFYNRYVIVARDYLVVKADQNHAYHICAFLDDSVLVQNEDGYGYQQFYMDGSKGTLYKSIPPNARRSIFQVQLGLQRLNANRH